ncbi:AI-2E family transporter [Nonomuraea rubra]|uniref:Putative PurR-regulated permease PerM n=1 Tax=Nonomuraea rubra TaxID=46180 RepID=A0A7X0TZ84_9ACTN|nr:AI-2E family transporter [Nonomuraea rubra]MBB6549223.1 putative PurR-regulated permease PerM [Nonomuraea rubra]
MTQQEGPRVVRVLLSPANVWRVAFAVVAVAAVVLFARFVLADAGGLIVVVVMAWFISLAMEPAVGRLARHMRRGAAALLVMVAFLLVSAVFLYLFGSLLAEQVAVLVRELPDILTGAVAWVNERFGTNYQIADILSSLNLTPQQAAQYAQDVLGNVLGLLGTLTGAIVNLFTLLLLIFYLSADGPRLRVWLARLMPANLQRVFLTVWDVSLVKTGGYVWARLILATVNAAASTVVFLVLGMPSWLALGLWTGLVAQLVPTIGTYIAIALPVVVGLVSPRPWIGLVALGWGVLYQQVENLTLEPRISGRSVDIHPGVAFAGVILGASLFGAVGALLAVPVVAMLLSLIDTFVARQDLVQAVPAGQAAAADHHSAAPPPGGPPPPEPDGPPSRAADGPPAPGSGEPAPPERGRRPPG